MSNPCEKTSLGSRSFEPADQERFAALSLDRNPMHMDPVAARRLLTGHAVVHGVHVVLAALELLAERTPIEIERVDCSFDNAVNVGDRVEFRLETSSPHEWRVDAVVNELRCARMSFSRRRDSIARPTNPAALGALASGGHEDVTGMHAPLDLDPEEQSGRAYCVRLPQLGAAVAFPRTCEQIGESSVAALCALSYFVGMVCPGLNSIFVSMQVRLEVGPVHAPELSFFVGRFDQRMRLFDVTFEGPIAGRLRAFSRPRPQAQPALRELANNVHSDEFRGTSSLVVGGSRGLGELTSKCLAAGGASVAITYATGAADAERVCAEINRGTNGLARALHWDITSKPLETLDFDWDSLDAVYYFATPRIYRKKAHLYDPQVHAEFCEFYLGTFYRMCEFLERLACKRTVKVFLPSTVFIADRPKGMTEYAMAKAAAEILAQELNRSFKRVRVHVERLPRMSTDQTLSILRVSTAPALPMVLRLVRAMQPGAEP